MNEMSNIQIRTLGSCVFEMGLKKQRICHSVVFTVIKPVPNLSDEKRMTCGICSWLITRKKEKHKQEYAEFSRELVCNAWTLHQVFCFPGVGRTLS